MDSKAYTFSSILGDILFVNTYSLLLGKYVHSLKSMHVFPYNKCLLYTVQLSSIYKNKSGNKKVLPAEIDHGPIIITKPHF